MYYNTMIIIRKPWMERRLIPHLLAMGYTVERIPNISRGWAIYDTSKEQQLFLQKWFPAITF